MPDTIRATIDALNTLETSLPTVITEALTQAGAELVAAARDRIGAEHPDWPPLTAETIAAKARAGETGRISPTDPLLATGELRDSYGATIDGATLIVGSTDPVAELHEHGTARMPPRPVLAPIAAEHGERIAQELGKAVADAIADALGRGR